MLLSAKWTSTGTVSRRVLDTLHYYSTLYLEKNINLKISCTIYVYVYN